MGKRAVKCCLLDKTWILPMQTHRRFGYQNKSKPVKIPAQTGYWLPSSHHLAEKLLVLVAEDRESPFIESVAAHTQVNTFMSMHTDISSWTQWVIGFKKKSWNWEEDLLDGSTLGWKEDMGAGHDKKNTLYIVRRFLWKSHQSKRQLSLKIALLWLQNY